MFKIKPKKRQAEEQCKKTITFDGLWKVNRSKCCYDKLYMQTDFGDVEIGCTDTPVRGSYFCRIHRACDLGFNVENKILFFKPHEIKLSLGVTSN